MGHASSAVTRRDRTLSGDILLAAEFCVFAHREFGSAVGPLGSFIASRLHQLFRTVQGQDVRAVCDALRRLWHRAGETSSFLCNGGKRFRGYADDARNACEGD